MTGFHVDPEAGRAPIAVAEWVNAEVRRKVAREEAEIVAVLYVVSFITGVPVATIIEDRRREVGW